MKTREIALWTAAVVAIVLLVVYYMDKKLKEVEDATGQNKLAAQFALQKVMQPNQPMGVSRTVIKGFAG